MLEKDSKKLNWSTIIGVSVFHIVAIGALFTFSWENLLAASILWWIAGSLGIGVGYHRLLTHRGFKAPRWLERTLSVFGSLAVQSGPITWVTAHRLHHAFTETDRDPHSPRHGTYWSHIGWIFRGTAQNNSVETMKRYSPDLMRDPFLVAVDKHYWVIVTAVAVVLFAIGGISMVFWGIFLRTVFGWHSTWLVNSATHLWGKRRFETRDDSRNNGFVAALTFGEGWHNNHHAYPRSARHGLRWYEFDVNWIQIKLLEKLGVIENVFAFDLKSEEPEEQIDLQPVQDAA
ncbi:MAG TPA: fatty acid desaturase [Pyrinomonadaceae bacterium]|jgi:stearoyl-CoA desaturase (delta-9 desaturase)|nr:fatty acid desaturase [Pyrinomonadaceae bacterium]